MPCIEQACTAYYSSQSTASSTQPTSGDESTPAETAEVMPLFFHHPLPHLFGQLVASQALSTRNEGFTSLKRMMGWMNLDISSAYQQLFVTTKKSRSGAVRKWVHTYATSSVVFMTKLSSVQSGIVPHTRPFQLWIQMDTGLWGYNFLITRRTSE